MHTNNYAIFFFAMERLLKDSFGCPQYMNSELMMHWTLFESCCCWRCFAAVVVKLYQLSYPTYFSTFPALNLSNLNIIEPPHAPILLWDVFVLITDVLLLPFLINTPSSYVRKRGLLCTVYSFRNIMFINLIVIIVIKCKLVINSVQTVLLCYSLKAGNTVSMTSRCCLLPAATSVVSVQTAVNEKS